MSVPNTASSSREHAQRSRVLVVDDNQSAANALGTLLRHHDFDVCVTYDGISAIELLNSFDADVVLLDIGLPYKDGYAIAREMRDREGGGKRMRLIAVSGYGQDDDKRKSEEAGFDLHLVKPVGMTALLESLDIQKVPDHG